MRTIENENDKVVCFDEKVWLQERNLIHFTHIDDEPATYVNMWTDLEGSHLNPIAKYTLDAEYMVTIDVTDYIRAYPNVKIIYVECQNDFTIAIPLEVVGLINPESVIIPDHKVTMFTIEPPKMMYKGAENTPVVEVMAKRFDTPIIDEIRVDGNVIQRGVLTPVSISHDTFDITNTLAHFTLTLDTYTLRDQVCGHRYALVRWVSAFGTTKVFTWEIVESKMSVGDTISLIPMIDDYNTIKGREDSFSLFLDNLSAYDYWYYSDIITSSKVEVSLDGVEWHQVDVTTKNVTIPDGDAGKMNELNVSVNYRKYDAVAM